MTPQKKKPPVGGQAAFTVRTGNLNPAIVKTDTAAPSVHAIKKARPELSDEDYQRRLRNSGIPLHYQRAPFNYEGDPLLESLVRNAEGWIDSFEPGSATMGYERFKYESANHLGLLLSGPCGCGKTAMAAAIAKQLIRNGLLVKWTSCASLMTRFHAACKPHAEETESEILWWCDGPDLLVIDDLGTTDYGPWEAGKLAYVLDLRFNNDRAILATTNLARPEIPAALGDRVASRLNLLPLLGKFPDRDNRPFLRDNKVQL